MSRKAGLWGFLTALVAAIAQVITTIVTRGKERGNEGN